MLVQIEFACLRATAKLRYAVASMIQPQLLHNDRLSTILKRTDFV